VSIAGFADTPQTGGELSNEVLLAAGAVAIIAAGNVYEARARAQGATILVFEFAAQVVEATPETERWAELVDGRTGITFVTASGFVASGPAVGCTARGHPCRLHPGVLRLSPGVYRLGRRLPRRAVSQGARSLYPLQPRLCRPLRRDRPHRVTTDRV
jgi:hypothetical protein